MPSDFPTREDQLATLVESKRFRDPSGQHAMVPPFRHQARPMPCATNSTNSPW